VKLRSTLGLLVLLVVLCAAYFGMGAFKQQQVTRAQEAKRLFAFGGDAVKRIELQQIGGPLTAAERGADGLWAINAPDPTIEPFQTLWNRMADRLAQLNNARSLPDTITAFDEYGFTDPVLRFTAAVEGADAIRLSFGNLEPTQKYRFARLNDGPIFLVAADEFFELNRPLDELRERFLVDDRDVPLLRFEFARIWTGREKDQEKMAAPPAVGTESTAIVVVRESADAAWRVIQPNEGPADQEAVNALISELQYGVGSTFIDKPEDLSDYGLKPASARITVVDAQSGKPQTLYLGDPDRSGAGTLYAQRVGRNAVFSVPGTLLSLLPSTPDALRERRLFTGEVKQVTQVVYRNRAGGLTLKRGVDGAWTMTDPPEADLSQAAVSNFLTGLKDYRLSSFLHVGSATNYGLDDPAISLEISLAGQDAPAVIRLIPREEDGKVFYAQQDTGAVGIVSSDLATRLVVSPETFRSVRLMNFPPGQAVSVSFGFEGRGYRFERVHEVWTVREPENASLLNQSDAEAIINAIAVLSAVNPAAEKQADPLLTGLDAPLLTISAVTRAENGTETTHGPLYVGKNTPDKAVERFAAVAGREGVYRVRQQLVDTLRDALRGLRLPPGG